MKKMICNLLLMMAFFGAQIAAQPSLTPAELKLGDGGTVKWVQGRSSPDQLGSFDSLVLWLPDAKDGGQVIFETEGRRLEKWEAVDLEGNGKSQLLLTLDPGGNGGFKEFALLNATGTRFSVVWEEALKMGSAETKDLDGDQKPEVVLSGKELNPATGKVSPKTMVFSWKEGTLVPLKKKK